MNAAVDCLSAINHGMPTAVNKRHEDLLLLAKNHYPVDCALEGARRVIAFHNMHRFGSLHDADVAHCVVHDLMPIVHQTLDARRVGDMLLSLSGRSPFGGYIEQAGGVFPGLIQMMLDHAGRVRMVAEDGRKLHSMPDADPMLLKLITAKDANDTLMQIGTGAA